MPEKLKVAVAGVGRMGPIHALHVVELARETGNCSLAALVDIDAERARQVAATLDCDLPVFTSLQELVKAGVSDATVVVTPTGSHRENTATLIAAGQRVLLEKPLTGTLDADREFSAQLDRDHPHAVMLAFQRRFDAPNQYARELMQSGTIGRVFKI
jgi:myo-inositol 2-dehydrogenase/D-chiro-inositol 1-dehydrogenase